jgi:iron complex transport system ATP-binding protein
VEPEIENIPIIDIRKATVYRGRTRVFDDLSLSIPIGCNTAILGPNGAGKSTLLRLLSQELFPVKAEGSYVKLWGKERWNVKELRKYLGIVSHDMQATYKPWVTGEEVVLSGYHASIGLWPHLAFDHDQRMRAAEVMEELDIAGLQHRRLEAMSTGEQRRFLLARALVHDPDVLVLDEPISGLDLKACFQYISTVRRLIGVGKTIILVTHHVHEVPPEIDRLILLQNGRVLDDGPKAALMTGPMLSRLFETPIDVIEANGFYQAVPAASQLPSIDPEKP